MDQDIEEWLTDTHDLHSKAVHLGGQTTIPFEEAGDWRRVHNACMGLLAVLQRLPPAAPPEPAP